jgi:hypothetical protein
MPNHEHGPHFDYKKRHRNIGNDLVRIVWGSGVPHCLDTLTKQFQFVRVSVVVEPHLLGAIATFSNSLHGNENFRVISR